MEHHFILFLSLFFGFFFLVTALLQVITKKTAIPFTVLLLLAGFFGQYVSHVLPIELDIHLSPDVVFYFLLPILLFEGAMHINIHQFRIQFKTISFFATVGLLISLFVIGGLLTLLLGLPLQIALLFGAIISATDPIAVLAIFKTLGAPKRLALVADGESMFNDATGVIAFRIISTFAVAGHSLSLSSLAPTLLGFFYVFLGSIIFGAVIGFVFVGLSQKVIKDRIIITALTAGLALVSFTAAEYFFKLSGVIATVMAGIIYGNFARVKMTSKVTHFLEEMWEYVGVLSLSLVFFFASYQLDLTYFTREIPVLFAVIAIVLIARSVSVYLTGWMTNTSSFFKDEPNIPFSWMHILNWGGLRGVIPLVLVYSLPETFVYKELMLRFTFATLLFTLFINGLTIKQLLVFLKLHLPGKEEEIIHDEEKLFAIRRQLEKLQNLDTREFAPDILEEYEESLTSQEKATYDRLSTSASSEEFLRSLQIESISVEREKLRELYVQGRMNEATYFSFASELDLQQDAIEYPDLYSRSLSKEGFIKTRISFRKRMLHLRSFIKHFPFISRWLHVTEDELVSERYSLLRARLFTSYAVLDYLASVSKLFTSSTHKQAIRVVQKAQDTYIIKNQKEVKQLEAAYPDLVYIYQQSLLGVLLNTSEE